VKLEMGHEDLAHLVGVVVEQEEDRCVEVGQVAAADLAEGGDRKPAVEP
jgi:hypothetical protein